MSKDPAVLDELRYDRDCETALEVAQKLKAQLTERIWKEIAAGEHTSDILNHVDGGDIVQIALAVISADPELELSRCGLAITDFKAGVEAYVDDLAEDML